MPTKTKAKKPAKSAKPKTAKKAKPKKLSAPMKAALDAVAAMPVRKESKLEAIIQLLSRPEGATIDDMVTATGWQKHTIRSALSHALAKSAATRLFPTNQRAVCGFTRSPPSRMQRSKPMQKGSNTGYAVHHLESLDGKRLMQRHELTLDDIKKAVEMWHHDSRSSIRTVIGVGNDGLIGSERNGWHPGLSDAFSNGLVMIPWIQILEILKRVPDGATGKFLSTEPLTKQ